ncbi:MAG: response regulator [Desulfobacteraceae bacterium]|nr:response regulator [Desulfobacteraceae bacterium]
MTLKPTHGKILDKKNKSLSDIAEYKNTKEALDQAHQSLLTVMNNIDACIYVTDLQTQEILFMNRPAKEKFGGDYTGQVCWRAFYELTRPCDDCNKDQLIDQTGQPTGLHVREKLNADTGCWHINHDRAVKWIDGRYARVQIATDITKVKEFEKERIDAEAQMRQAQKLEAMQTLAAGIAKDFNGMLSSILNYAGSALDEAQNNRTSVPFLREIIKAGHQAKELAHQILTYSRRTENIFKPIQIKPIINEALKSLKTSLPSTIKIESNLISEAIVEADSTQIHQVIMNLFSNACHAMREQGGVLTVGLTKEVLSNNFTRHYPGMLPGNYLRLEVSDTGHGICPSIVDKLFDPYFTTKTDKKGSGIGLSVVQAIIQNCGGAISVGSRAGELTTFKIYLPIFLQTAVYSPADESIAASGNERILFVDDEPDLAELGGRLLKKMGYQATICTSSADALALFKKTPNEFDLLVTDMTMPTMTGDILSKKIRAIRPDIPIVICTSYSEKVTWEMIEQLAIRSVIMKPLALNEMALCIRQALDDK